MELWGVWGRKKKKREREKEKKKIPRRSALTYLHAHCGDQILHGDSGLH